MIKGLKKLFIGLSISLPILFASFSSAGLQEFDLGLAEEITANSNLGYSLELLSNANFLLNDQFKIIQFQGADSYPTLRTYFWNGSGMYVMDSCQGGYNCNGSIQGQGYIQYVNIVDLSTIDYNYSVPYGFIPVSEFLENPIYNNPDKLLLGGYGGMQSSSLCFGYSDIDKAVCFYWDRSEWNNCGGHPQFCTNGQLSYVINSQGYSSQELQYLSSFATNSPFTQGGTQNIQIPSSTGLDSYIYVEIGTGDIIDYFEVVKGFRGDMCYVGTKDLVSNYEDRVVYNQGTGYTIFDTYSKLFDTTNMTLNNVGTFVNTWVLNYNNWFLDGWNLHPENAYINWYYSGVNDYGAIRGQNLSSPFLGNKAVYFFIGSSFSAQNVDFLSANGHELLYYCYKKLSNPSNDGDTYNIVDDHSLSYDENVAVYSSTKRAQITYYSGANEILGQSWEGTPLDYFTGGGTGYTDFSDFFNQTFNKFKFSWGDLNYSDLGLGVLPTYIIWFLLALILFRFLSR